MIGTTQDIIGRFKATLPVGWFIEPTPVLDSLLSGMATAWSWCYCQIQFIQSEARLATASSFGLDLFANDFFGSAVVRGGDSDEDFRARISSDLLRARGTRSALAAVLSDLTGRQPFIFEPAQPRDCGAYSGIGGAQLGMAYSVIGGWGSLQMPFQTFVVAYRPKESGIPLVGGWGCYSGGYGGGCIEYASLAMSQGQVADVDILSAIASVMPVATTAWARISN